MTTEGHRDVIEMREGLKDDRYNFRMPPPEQLVARKMRLGVRERIRADGRIETPLDHASLDAAIATLNANGSRRWRCATCTPWRDPGHEEASREAVERELPGTYVSLSAEVLPQIRNSSGSRRQSSTPMSARCCRATWRGSTGAWSKLAIAARS